MTEEVLYEEVDGIAIVAINRPEKKNTLTEDIVRGIADGIDAASRSKEVAAIVLRGVGGTFTAGYDLTHVAPPGELAALIESDAQRFRHIPANQLALNKLLINQAFENMGLRTTQLIGTLFDGIARHTEEAYRWAESFEEKGFREVIRERDTPWGDYGERPVD